MPLRFDLGPFEKLYIGKSVLTNNGGRTMFVVEGDAPILRARDVLTAERAISAVEQLYRCVQQMYLDEDILKHQGSYLALAAQAVIENPACNAEILIADEEIKLGRFYKALKTLKQFIRPDAFPLANTESERHRPRLATSRRH